MGISSRQNRSRISVQKAFSVFIVVCLVVLSFTPPALAAEKTIGVIMTGNIAYYREVHKGFIAGLNEADILATGKYDVVVQNPAPEMMSWINSVRKLTAIGSVVIVAYGAPATIVSLEMAEVPVVFAGVYDPKAIGINSKNATGISSKVPLASLLKKLKSISNFSRLGVIFNASEKDTVLQANEVRQLEAGGGFQSVRYSMKRSEDAAKISNVDALFVSSGCIAMQCVGNIVDVARKAKIPSAATIGGGEMDGIILTLTANPFEQGKEAGRLVSRILKGEKPSSLPIVQPKTFDFVINLREATSLGLKIPADLLTTATKVIR
jgi:putative ABC transport system substrate-binding protein